MKWSKEQEQQLRDLCFQEKSNKEIASIMEIELSDVHAGRSRFGITVAKVAAIKAIAKEGQAAYQRINRSIDNIVAEITKVEKAQVEAVKKVWKCTQRLEVLREELKATNDSND